MINYQQAEKIDELIKAILKLSSDIPNKNIRVEKLLDKLNIKYSELEFYVEKLIFEIQYEEHPIIRWIEENNEYMFLSSNYITKQFIESGGAVQWLKNELVKKQKEEERKTLEEQKLKAEIKEFRLKKWQFWLTFGIAVVGLILSILSLIIKPGG